MVYPSNGSTSRLSKEDELENGREFSEQDMDEVDDGSSIGGEPDYAQHAKEDWRRFDDFVTIGPVNPCHGLEARLRERSRLGARYVTGASEEKRRTNAGIWEIDHLQLDSCTGHSWTELLCTSSSRYVSFHLLILPS